MNRKNFDTAITSRPLASDVQQICHKWDMNLIQ